MCEHKQDGMNFLNVESVLPLSDFLEEILEWTLYSIYVQVKFYWHSSFEEKNHLGRHRYAPNALMPVRRDLSHCWSVWCVSQYCCVMFLPALVLQTRLEWEMIFETVDYTLLFKVWPMCIYNGYSIPLSGRLGNVKSWAKWDVIRSLKAVRHC